MQPASSDASPLPSIRLKEDNKVLLAISANAEFIARKSFNDKIKRFSLSQINRVDKKFS